MLIAARPTPVAGAKIVFREPGVVDRVGKMSPAMLSNRRSGRVLGQVREAAQHGRYPLMARGKAPICQHAGGLALRYRRPDGRPVA
jgi:hypothetical protein